jgi:hypothetical protein
MAVIEEMPRAVETGVEPGVMPVWFPVEGYDDVAQKLVKEAVCGAIGLVPVVGGVLGKVAGLALDCLWPNNGGDITWQGIVDKVKAIVGKEIQDYYNSTCKQELQDMKEAVAAYRIQADLVVAGKGDKAWTLNRLNNAIDRIQNHMGRFSVAKYKYQTLGFYAHAANLNLLLLKDKVKNGEKLNASKTEIDAARSDLVRLGGPGGVYPKYVKDTFDNGWYQASYPTYVQCHDYARVMYLAAYEFISLWEHLVKADPPKQIDRKVELHFGPVGWYKWRAYWKWQEGVFPPPHRTGTTVRMDGLIVFRTSKNGVKAGVPAVQSRHNGVWGNIWGNKTGTMDTVELSDGEYFEKVSFYWHPGANSRLQVAWNALQCLRLWTNKNAMHTLSETWDFPDQVPAFGIPGFRLYDIMGFSNHGDSGFLQALIFAFRPVDEAWKPKNTRAALISGGAYNLIEASTGRMLDVDHYTLTEAAAPVAHETSGTVSRNWLLHEAGDGTWRLINQYSNQILGVTDGAARLDQAPESHQDSTWTITSHDDGTCTLAAGDRGEHVLSLGIDGAVDAAARRQDGGSSRWVLVPASAPPDDTLDHLLPTLRVSQPTQEAPTSANLTLDIPATGCVDAQWRLRFSLPAESHRGLSLSGAGLKLASRTLPRGTEVTITPEPDHAQDPAEHYAFTLSCASGRILPTDVSLNDRAVLVRAATTPPIGMIDAPPALQT